MLDLSPKERAYLEKGTAEGRLLISILQKIVWEIEKQEDYQLEQQEIKEREST